ncbi:MAG: SGNH/GDSL hydrolase family protein [Clostridia bacterium]|nr:SGNH/GDSL hydrolase family protein [Clostridia bacterium]
MYNNKGKISKCVIYGDSISTTDFSRGGYQQLLKDHLNIGEMINYAVSASGTAPSTPNSVYEKIIENEKIEEDADLIIVWSGTNDWYWNVELGDIDNFSENTYCGAMRKCLLTLTERCETANIITMTPIARWQAPDGMTIDGDAHYYKNKAGHTLYEYSEMLEKLTAAIGIPMCDMRRLSGINIKNKDIYLRDNVHPSRLGYLRIAEIIAAFTNNLSFIKNDE